MLEESFLCVHAHRCDDIATAVRIAEEFSFPTRWSTAPRAPDRPFLAERGVRAAVGPTLTGKPKLELRNKTWILWPFGRRGPLHIITDHPVIPIDTCPYPLTGSQRAGLPEEAEGDHLRRRAPGHQDRVGSVGRGRMPTLQSGTATLHARSRVRYTIIDGETVYSA